MPKSGEFDIVVYGASGFTGRLVAEYLARRYDQGNELTWAMAGRDAGKLASVRDEIGAAADTPLIVADVGDAASLKAMAVQAKAIITTVGPYQLWRAPGGRLRGGGHGLSRPVRRAGVDAPHDRRL